MFRYEVRHLLQQQTLSRPVSFVGFGAITGRRSTVQVFPAAADTGLCFVRCDLPREEGRLHANWDTASDSAIGTQLRNRFGHHLAPVEHLLSALAGLGIDNAEIFVDGPEIPLMDGSALPFVSAFTAAGVVSAEAERDLLLVRNAVRIEHGDTWAELLPDLTQRISLAIESPCPSVGTQTLSLCLAPSVYVRELAAARTFGFAESRARAGRIGDADPDGLERTGKGPASDLAGIRFPDEYVRHKALDILGDLALAGHTVVGHLRTNRPAFAMVRDLVALAEQASGALERVSAGRLYDCRTRGECLLQMGLGGSDDEATAAFPGDQVAADARHTAGGL